MEINRTIAENSLTKDVDMPVLYIADIKKRLEGMGAQVKNDTFLTSGPRTMFKYVFEWKKELDTFSYISYSVKINGEFLTNSNHGNVQVDYKIDFTANLPKGGFMTSCLNETYRRYMFDEVEKRANEEVRDFIKNLNWV